MMEGDLKIKEIEEKFLVSYSEGFNIANPEEKLPDRFHPYEDLASSVAQMVEEGILRKKVDELTVDVDRLNVEDLTKKKLLLAHLVLTVIQSGYVWQYGDKDPAKILPRCIAVPLCKVSDMLGMKPIISYPSLILANWKRIKDGNLCTLYNTPGGDGTSWFILTHNCIEREFAPIIKAILFAVAYAENKNYQGLTESLQQIPPVLQKMKKIFTRIEDGVQPKHFYEKLRIFLTGWDEKSAVLPEGLLYEGVSDKPMHLKGGSGAQSTTLQVMDVAFGVEHDGDQKQFLEEVRNYMLKEHRDFITYIKKRSQIRKVVQESKDQTLREAYNKCLEQMRFFRLFHNKIIIKKYILDQKKTTESRDGKGTAGTELNTFLDGVVNKTVETKLSSE